jgi:hypothetical protein
LKTVDLGSNYLDGTVDYLQLSEAAVVLLDVNTLSSTIPSNIQDLLPMVEEFWLSENNMTGKSCSIRNEFDSYFRRMLIILCVFWIGSLPTTLGLMSHLHELYLFNNSFTNTLPTEVGQLTNGLVSLAFEFNSLTGTSFFIVSGLLEVVVNLSGVVIF